MNRSQILGLAYLAAVVACVLAGKLGAEALLTTVPALLLQSPMPTQGTDPAA